jgi:transcriptional regulator with XRE-family HTH domain
VTPAQCRAARALLNWSQVDLVDQSGVTQKSITDFERGLTAKPHRQTLIKLVVAFEDAGIEFIPRGVRMRSSTRRSQPKVERDE